MSLSKQIIVTCYCGVPSDVIDLISDPISSYDDAYLPPLCASSLMNVDAVCGRPLTKMRNTPSYAIHPFDAFCVCDRDYHHLCHVSFYAWSGFLIYHAIVSSFCLKRSHPSVCSHPFFFVCVSFWRIVFFFYLPKMMIRKKSYCYCHYLNDRSHHQYRLFQDHNRQSPPVAALWAYHYFPPSPPGMLLVPLPFLVRHDQMPRAFHPSAASYPTL